MSSITDNDIETLIKRAKRRQERAAECLKEAKENMNYHTITNAEYAQQEATAAYVLLHITQLVFERQER